MLQIPIFHVNGEDPEAVAQVVRLAMDFRKEFKRDVVIDMYCYRRRGHNEGDEPSFTQPVMYRAIEQRKSVRDAYLDRLLQMGEITKAEADGIVKELTEELEHELSVARSEKYVQRDGQANAGIWKGYVGGRENEVPDVDTGIPLQQAGQLVQEAHRRCRRISIRIPRSSSSSSSERKWAAAKSRSIGRRPRPWPLPR